LRYFDHHPEGYERKGGIMVAGANAAFKVSETTKRFLKEALKEDVGKGDVTTGILFPATARTRGVILAKERGIFCGRPILEELARFLDPSLKMKFLVPEGKPFRKNQIVIQLNGCVRSILKGERTLLNLLGRLSGISTLTRQYVEAVKRYPVLILDTRKTTPLWREIEKYAVRIGGGRNHRMGLFDAIFVKENHRIHGDFQKLDPYRGCFEIEVRNLKELKEALRLTPRVILFDNFTPARLHRGIQMARQENPAIILEVSGGMTLDNVAQYAAMGIDWISVGSLTRSQNSIDFSLLIH